MLRRCSTGVIVCSKRLPPSVFLSSGPSKEASKSPLIPTRVDVEKFIQQSEPVPSVITVKQDVAALDTVATSFVPREHVEQRRARIFVPAQNAMQSGSANTHLWKIELDNRERWENPLMGWSSSGDPMSNLGMNVDFASKEDAIRFCEKCGWEYEIVEPNQKKLPKRAYGDNFSWSRRTRTTNK